MIPLSDLTVLKPKRTVADTDWFQQDRFGLFIHWGIYAGAAYGEWVKHTWTLTHDQYEPYFRHFEPDLYAPEQWAKAAKDAGMRYFMVTSKHHDGFCLWDSDFTDYKSTNTPLGLDLLTPMVDAFRREGLRVGLYHSLVDWHHPDYTMDSVHPMRDVPEYAALDAQRDLSRYVDTLHNQVEELLRRYDPVDILWFDFSVKADGKYGPKGKEEWRSEELLRKIRAIRPSIIVNERMECVPDVVSAEQWIPDEWVTEGGEPVVWESCYAASPKWGYHVGNVEGWRTPQEVIQLLVKAVSNGGNFVLNIAPNARGELDAPTYNILSRVGAWMRLHNQSIYGCTKAPLEFDCPEGCRMTYNPQTQRLYLHLMNWPGSTLFVRGELAQHIEYARFLHDHSRIEFYDTIALNDFDSAFLEFRPRVLPEEVIVPVIEIFLK